MHRLVLLLTLLLTPLAAAQTPLIVAQGGDAVTLDAHDIVEAVSGLVSRQLHETLFEVTPAGTIEPLLAEDYDVSEDGLTWTITLKEGITFHDGTPFNAEAVKFNLERFIDPDNGFVFSFLLNRIETVAVIDEYTVALTLSGAFAPLLAHLSHLSTAMVSPTAVETFGEDYYRNPVGTGPFVFDNWTVGQQLEVARFADYWGEAAGSEVIRFVPVPENTTRMALLESGEAHVVVSVPPQDVPRLSADPDINVDLTPSTRTIYIYFNPNIEPFGDVRVRQAVNFAVDKQAIVDFVLGGAGTVSEAPFSPGIFGYDPQEPYPYDPEQAQALLADAGYPEGFTTTLYCPTGRYLQDIQVCEAIQSQIADVGIDASIETFEWAAYLQRTGLPVAENDIPMAMYGWATGTGDADYALFPLLHSSQHVPNGSNRSFYSNATVDELLSDARTIADQELRESLYNQAIDTLWEDAPWLYLHVQGQLTGIRNEVENLVVYPTQGIWLKDASLSE